MADTDATVAKAQELGATLHAPDGHRAGRFAVLADPQGAIFNVLTLKPEMSG